MESTSENQNDPMYDTIVVGGGPSGLIAAIAAAQGTPNISPDGSRKGSAKVVVLESYRKPGGIAAFGSLVLTDQWAVQGGKLKSMLLEQLSNLGVEVVTDATVSEVLPRANGFEVLTKGNRRYSAMTVILACGIFPHIGFLKYQNTLFLATGLEDQEKFIKWAEQTVLGDPTLSRKILLVGCNDAVTDAAKRLAKLSDILKIEVLVESEYSTAERKISELLEQSKGLQLKLDPNTVEALAGCGGWNDGSEGMCSGYFGICFDYNSYKIRPESPARFIQSMNLEARNGYIVTDQWYRTSIPGIWACGNAVFPVSGVLQALYSGFVAGLSARSKTSAAQFDSVHGLLPWLPFPNQTWAEWLEQSITPHSNKKL